MRHSSKTIAAVAAIALLSACKTATQTDDAAVSGDGTTTADGTAGGTSIPSLVNVNLENVLNNLSVALNVEEANIPVNAQVPIEVAANVCGVSVNALGASIASGEASCTATTTSPELVQVVQQQISAGGDVGGGDQTTSPPDSNLM
jgi:hypothetical protein